MPIMAPKRASSHRRLPDIPNARASRSNIASSITVPIPGRMDYLASCIGHEHCTPWAAHMRPSNTLQLVTLEPFCQSRIKGQEHWLRSEGGDAALAPFTPG